MATIRPNIIEIQRRLAHFSDNLLSNNQIGNSKIILALADLISVLNWSSAEQEKYSVRLIRLTWAIVVLTVMMLAGLVVQIVLAR